MLAIAGYNHSRSIPVSGRYFCSHVYLVFDSNVVKRGALRITMIHPLHRSRLWVPFHARLSGHIGRHKTGHYRDGVAGGQHDHGQGRVVTAEPVQHMFPVHARQQDVEDHRFRAKRLEGGKCGEPVGFDEHFKSAMLQFELELSRN